MKQEIDPFDLRAQQAASALVDEATRLKRQTEVEDLKFIMSTKQGRRYVWRQLERYGVFRTSFSSDPLIMAYNEGSRNQGLGLIADISEHCPERYAEMTREQRKAKEKEHGRGNANDQ